MSDFWNSYGFGGAFGASKTGRRIIRVLLPLVVIGIVVAGFIHAGIVFHAVSERSSAPHVHTHSTH